MPVLILFAFALGLVLIGRKRLRDLPPSVHAAHGKAPQRADRPAVQAGVATPPHPPQRRLIELDSLRGIAALVVVLYHFTTDHQSETGFIGRPTFDFWWGDNGVEVFFIISGFVIFMTLNRTTQPLEFIVSRFSRLYPAYWAAILFTTVTVLLTGVESFRRTPDEIAANFTMLQRLPGIDVRDVDFSYWSLYTELLFYLVMLALFATNQLKRIELYLTAALLSALAFHGTSLLFANSAPTSPEARVLGHVGNVLPYAPLFVAGICLHRLWSRTNVRSAAVLLCAALGTAYLTLLPEQFVAAALGMSIMSLIIGGQAGFLRARPLVWLGGLSYSLYLVHNAAGRAVIRRLEEAGWSADAAIVAAILFAFAAAIVIHRLVELPAQKWIRHHYKRRLSSQQSSGFAPGLR